MTERRPPSVHNPSPNRPNVDLVFERMTEAVWAIVPHSGEVLYLNPAAERLHGRSRLDFQANAIAWFDSIHPHDRDRVRRPLIPAETDRPVDVVLEYRIRRPDGDIRWVRSQIWQTHCGGSTCLQGLTTDLTEYRQTQQKTLQFEKLANNLPGVIYQYVIAADGSSYFSYMRAC